MKKKLMIHSRREVGPFLLGVIEKQRKGIGSGNWRLPAEGCREIMVAVVLSISIVKKESFTRCFFSWCV